MHHKNISLFLLGFNWKLDDVKLFTYFQYINKYVAKFYNLRRGLK